MKDIPQYKVIGPYNDDRIIHDVEKCMLSYKIFTSDKWKVGF